MRLFLNFAYLAIVVEFDVPHSIGLRQNAVNRTKSRHSAPAYGSSALQGSASLRKAPQASASFSKLSFFPRHRLTE
jgi:hypothetical protein